MPRWEADSVSTFRTAEKKKTRRQSLKSTDSSVHSSGSKSTIQSCSSSVRVRLEDTIQKKDAELAEMKEQFQEVKNQLEQRDIGFQEVKEQLAQRDNEVQELKRQMQLFMQRFGERDVRPMELEDGQQAAPSVPSVTSLQENPLPVNSPRSGQAVMSHDSARADPGGGVGAFPL